MIFQKRITFDKSIKEQTFYKALADNGINFFKKNLWLNTFYMYKQYKIVNP